MSDVSLLTLSKGEESVKLDLATLCVQAERSTLSPIDEYYAHAKELLVLSLSADELLLRLLLLELVSTAEMYFRQVLASLPRMCPVSKECASKAHLALGAMTYYHEDWLPLGLLEHQSLSGKGEVKKATFHLTGIAVPENGSVSKALEDFERICQLRHAIVHARGNLWFKNASDLGLPLDPQLQVRLNAMGFQTLVAQCHNAVRAFNAYIAEKILGNWIGKRVLSGSWRTDKARFAAYHALFASKEDGVGDLEARAAYKKVQLVLKKV